MGTFYLGGVGVEISEGQVGIGLNYGGYGTHAGYFI
jgi:hypothetical protein